MTNYTYCTSFNVPKIAYFTPIFIGFFMDFAPKHAYLT